LTSGSPANPQALNAAGQYLQWTAGGGFTIRQGFRIGASGFRGPYLERVLTALLPAGSTIRDFPASAFGIDGQWAWRRWSVHAEWQRFRFGSPNFVVAPSLSSSYAEVKSILTPRLYMAGRLGRFTPGGAVDRKGISTTNFAPAYNSLELATGCWLNRHQILKVSYAWLKREGQAGNRSNVLGFQLVTTLHPPQWAIH
jgi:hypothetical protein